LSGLPWEKGICQGGTDAAQDCLHTLIGVWIKLRQRPGKLSVANGHACFCMRLQSHSPRQIGLISSRQTAIHYSMAAQQSAEQRHDNDARECRAALGLFEKGH
jgi:hypothetical protein